MPASAVRWIYSSREEQLALVGGKGRRIAKHPSQWDRLKYVPGQITVDREVTLSNSNNEMVPAGVRIKTTMAIRCQMMKMVPLVVQI